MCRTGFYVGGEKLSGVFLLCIFFISSRFSNKSFWTFLENFVDSASQIRRNTLRKIIFFENILLNLFVFGFRFVRKVFAF